MVYKSTRNSPKSDSLDSTDSSEYNNSKNPILNSPKDITNDLINRIINNDLESLTINYEFSNYLDDSKHYDEWKLEQIKINPFKRANAVQPIHRIEFEVLLTPKVSSLDAAFQDLADLEYINLKDTSNIKSMSHTFERASTFNQPIGDWDTSNVTNMCGMFAEAKNFNQPIGDWDTSKVTDMCGMFMHAKSFNQPINNWNTTNVKDMGQMFYRAESFNQPIGNWDTSNVRCMIEMFAGAISFNQTIGNWNTSNVETMTRMFMEAESFNQPVGNWDTSKVNDMTFMFLKAESYSYARPKSNKTIDKEDAFGVHSFEV